MEYNRDVLAIPGGIFSPNSQGPNMLIRDGAIPIHCAQDICEVFGINPRSVDTPPVERSAEESMVIALVREPMTRDEISQALSIDMHALSVLLSKLELAGVIVERSGKIEVCIRS
jgi:DNA processing protein